jgi:hypothetical protein
LFAFNYKQMAACIFVGIARQGQEVRRCGERATGRDGDPDVDNLKFARQASALPKEMARLGRCKAYREVSGQGPAQGRPSVSIHARDNVDSDNS